VDGEARGEKVMGVLLECRPFLQEPVAPLTVIILAVIMVRGRAYAVCACARAASLRAIGAKEIHMSSAIASSTSMTRRLLPAAQRLRPCSRVSARTPAAYASTTPPPGM